MGVLSTLVVALNQMLLGSPLRLSGPGVMGTTSSSVGEATSSMVTAEDVGPAPERLFCWEAMSTLFCSVMCTGRSGYSS